MECFKSLFQPKGVAVIGSATEGKLGNVLLHRLVEGGFAKVYAVNPKAKGIDEVQGFTSVTAIPEKPDLAVIASPAATVKDVLEDCGKAKVKAAVIISSGFGETGNREGEAEIKAVAEKYGIRFVGPNCAGIMNTHAYLFASLEETPPTGGVALVSQSGSIGGIMMDWGEKEGIGFSKFISYGNGSDLTIFDFLNYLKDDPETKVVALYIEHIQNGREFMRVLKEVTKKKPVVLVKAGRTESGRRAAASHTGSMAGVDNVYDAAVKECGAIRVNNLEEMFCLCKAFALMPTLTNNRLLIVTNSGGPAIMATDKADAEGLSVKETSLELKAKLKQYLPVHASLGNPVDITVEGTAQWYKQTIVDAMAEYDAALAIYVGTPYLEAMPIAEAIAEAAIQAGKPIVSDFHVGLDIDESIEILRKAGVTNFSTGERGAWVLAKMLSYYKYLQKPVKVLEPETNMDSLPEGKVILEPLGMKILQKNAIPTPEFRFIQDIADVGEACQQIGYPVVMKVVSPDIIHKSDVGGVKIDIYDEEAANAAYLHLEQIATGKDFRGVIIYPMLPKATEVIFGINRDPQFGPLVLFGLGGIYSEVLKDIALRIAPVDEKGALEMIKSIKSYPILAGGRGQKPLDVAGLAKALANFSRLPFIYPDLQEADLNPVFVYEDKVMAADVRLISKK
ncbi:MAG: acetate--CoA ligase family protein [Clostridia bacterium]|nr:acetate--CoA ligase family protein [Clostridia bacterium]